MWLTLWFASYFYWGALNQDTGRNKGDKERMKNKGGNFPFH